MYNLYIENKSPDQLRIYCAADLWLCFSHMQFISRFAHEAAHYTCWPRQHLLDPQLPGHSTDIGPLESPVCSLYPTPEL